MQIKGKGTVYKNEYGYSISDNQKKQDGTIERFYIPIGFKKDGELPEDKFFIEFEGFTKPYKSKDGKTMISYFATNWRLATVSTHQEGRSYKWYAVRLEKNGDFQYKVQRATDISNVKANIDKDIPDGYYTHHFHFDTVLAEFNNEKEAKEYIDNIENKSISDDPFADFGEMVSIDDNWLD